VEIPMCPRVIKLRRGDTKGTHPRVILTKWSWGLEIMRCVSRMSMVVKILVQSRWGTRCVSTWFSTDHSECKN
jgi:hypothetical protein